MSVEIDGYDVRPLVAGADAGHEDIENFSRSANGEYAGGVFARKRNWSFRLHPTMTDKEHRALRGWVTGRRWTWNFERVDGATTRYHAYEDGGGVGWAAVTGWFSSSASSKFGTWAFSPSSGGYSAVSLDFNVANGYSWGVWKLVTGGYQWCAVTWDTVTTRYTVGGSSNTTTAFGWGQGPTGTVSASFYLQLWGSERPSVSSTTAVYDQPVVAPYAWLNEQIDALASRTAVLPPGPFVEFDGGLNDESDPIVVKVDVKDEGIEEVAYAGGVANSRWLRISLIER